MYGILRSAEPQVDQCPAVEDVWVVRGDRPANESAGVCRGLRLQVERAIAIVQRLVQIAVVRRPNPAERVQPKGLLVFERVMAQPFIDLIDGLRVVTEVTV